MSNDAMRMDYDENPSGRCGGLMVSGLYSVVEWSGLKPGRGHCVEFLSKTLSLSQCLSQPRANCSKGAREVTIEWIV